MKEKYEGLVKVVWPSPDDSEVLDLILFAGLPVHFCSLFMFLTYMTSLYTKKEIHERTRREFHLWKHSFYMLFVNLGLTSTFQNVWITFKLMHTVPL